MSPPLRPCGRPECRICRWRAGDRPDSGQPGETLASLLLGAAVIVLVFTLAFVLLPALSFQP